MHVDDEITETPHLPAPKTLTIKYKAAEKMCQHFRKQYKKDNLGSFFAVRTKFLIKSKYNQVVSLYIWPFRNVYVPVH